MARVWSALLFCLGLAVAACGKAGQSGPDSGGDLAGGGDAATGGTGVVGGGTAGSSDAGAGGDACAETERTAGELAINLRTSSMVDSALPNTLVPLYIRLVELASATGSTKEERADLYGPYLDVLEARLVALGATEIGRNDSYGSANASVEAQYVHQVLCWPDVVYVDVDAGYYDIAVPPWSNNEAGERACPLNDGVCPEYCAEYYALPFDETAGCFAGHELVVCQRSDRELNEDAWGCYENEATGVPILFLTLTPAAPGYLGWSECSDPTAAMGLVCEGEEQP